MEADVNQLRWAIEEKASKDIMLVWFSPAILPHSAVIAADTKIKDEDESWGILIRDNGMIFCHVVNKKPLIKLIDAITNGNHEWNGALPTFISRAALDKMLECDQYEVIIKAIIKRPEAKLCGIKYLIEVSASVVDLLGHISGVKTNMLNSIIIHENMEFAVTRTSRVVIINKITNIGVFGLTISYFYSAFGLKSRRANTTLS